jgi:hypothetical protein
MLVRHDTASAVLPEAYESYEDEQGGADDSQEADACREQGDVTADIRSELETGTGQRRGDESHVEEQGADRSHDEHGRAYRAMK